MSWIKFNLSEIFYIEKKSRKSGCTKINFLKRMHKDCIIHGEFSIFTSSKNEVAALQLSYHLVIQTIDQRQNLMLVR